MQRLSEWARDFCREVYDWPKKERRNLLSFPPTPQHPTHIRGAYIDKWIFLLFAVRLWLGASTKILLQQQKCIEMQKCRALQLFLLTRMYMHKDTLTSGFFFNSLSELLLLMLSLRCFFCVTTTREWKMLREGN